MNLLQMLLTLVGVGSCDTLSYNQTQWQYRGTGCLCCHAGTAAGGR